MINKTKTFDQHPIGNNILLQMKRTPTPSPQRPQSSHRRQDSSKSQHGFANATNKNDQKSNSAFKFITVAAKKIAGIFTLAFLCKSKKDSTEDIKDGQSRGLSSFEFSAGSYSRYSSSLKYSDSLGYGSSGIPASGPIGASNFTFEQINKATQKFSPVNKLGEGGFGAVYKGRLENGLVVAVKRAKRNTYDRLLSSEFKNEIMTLSTIEHLNLVRLYGYLEHGDERLIVVEYVGNGTLREHLDGTRGDGLEMAGRLDIAIDVAHAITYLHMYTDPPIIHRDIKASNILITEKLRAKVADFGFARRVADQDNGATHISTQVKGTAGYLDPEYLRTYQLTDKSDVYSFGVLLVELVTGRQPIETKRPNNERLTTRWAMQKLKHGDYVITMDLRLRRNAASTMAAEKILRLAHQCLAPLRHSRPPMKKCAEVLWGIRKDFRDKAFPAHPSPISTHSSNFPHRDAKKNRHHTFGIEDEDNHNFISA